MANLGRNSGHIGVCHQNGTRWGYSSMMLASAILLTLAWPVGAIMESKPEKNAVGKVPSVLTSSSPSVSGKTAPGKNMPSTAASAGQSSTGKSPEKKPSPSAVPAGLKMPTTTVQGRYAYLKDLSTQCVLLDKGADESMAPSSMTKIVTVYLMLQALAQKSLDWSDMIYVSKNAATRPGSRMFIKPEESIRVIDLLKGIVVTSGNDACTAIAEHLGGSEEGFAELMNTLALNIGMNHSHFVNASGLPDAGHYSTCKDLAIIAERTIKDFPKEYSDFYKLTSFKFNGIQQPNRNDLLKGGFADGMKTGMTDAGKYGIVATAVRPGYPPRRLLLVLNGVASSSLRAAEARRLLNWGFQRFESLVVPKGRHMATLSLWKEGSVNLVTESDWAVTLPKGTLHRAKMMARYHQPLTAPIVKGQKLGELVIHIDELAPMVMPLVAEKDVPAPGLWSALKGMFSGHSPAA